jgi:hypothetical protein
MKSLGLFVRSRVAVFGAAVVALVAGADSAMAQGAATVPDIGYNANAIIGDLATKLGTAIGLAVGFAFAIALIFYSIKLVRRHLLGRAG